MPCSRSGGNRPARPHVRSPRAARAATSPGRSPACSASLFSEYAGTLDSVPNESTARGRLMPIFPLAPSEADHVRPRSRCRRRCVRLDLAVRTTPWPGADLGHDLRALRERRSRPPGGEITTATVLLAPAALLTSLMLLTLTRTRSAGGGPVAGPRQSRHKMPDSDAGRPRNPRSPTPRLFSTMPLRPCRPTRPRAPGAVGCQAHRRSASSPSDSSAPRA